MPADFSGHEVGSIPQGLRNQQWVLFDLVDPAMQAALCADHAAWHSPSSGSLVGIFLAADMEPKVEAVIGGEVIKSGDKVVPPHIRLVDRKGHNLTVAVKDKDTGHGEWKSVYYWFDSPGIKNIRPVQLRADLPPDRKFDRNWLASFDGPPIETNELVTA